jgi:hypothetical protein
VTSIKLELPTVDLAPSILIDHSLGHICCVVLTPAGTENGCGYRNNGTQTGADPVPSLYYNHPVSSNEPNDAFGLVVPFYLPSHPRNSYDSFVPRTEQMKAKALHTKKCIEQRTTNDAVDVFVTAVTSFLLVAAILLEEQQSISRIALLELCE